MPAKRGENPMNIVYDIIVDLSRRDAARKTDGWVELAHVVSMAGHKALPEELVLEAVNTWCSLSAMNMNPEKTMIQFAVGGWEGGKVGRWRSRVRVQELCDNLVSSMNRDLATILQDKWPGEPAKRLSKALKPRRRPPPLQTEKECETHHCMEHPEQSECRGLCRRKVEMMRVEEIQLRAAGKYRSQPNIQAKEIELAIQQKDDPPPSECTFRACKAAQMRRYKKDFGMLESNVHVDESDPDAGRSGLLESALGPWGFVLTLAPQRPDVLAIAGMKSILWMSRAVAALLSVAAAALRDPRKVAPALDFGNGGEDPTPTDGAVALIPVVIWNSGSWHERVFAEHFNGKSQCQHVVRVTVVLVLVLVVLESLEESGFLPLCAPEIVEDTCLLLNADEKHDDGDEWTTSEQLEEQLVSYHGAMSQFWEAIGLPQNKPAGDDGSFWVECEALCAAVKSYVEKVAICPPDSDVSCYNVEGETYCDLDVRPSILKGQGPREEKDIPDFGDKEFLHELDDEPQRRGRAREPWLRFVQEKQIKRESEREIKDLAPPTAYTTQARAVDAGGSASRRA
eukprot:s3214_g7.t2